MGVSGEPDSGGVGLVMPGEIASALDNGAPQKDVDTQINPHKLSGANRLEQHARGHASNFVMKHTQRPTPFGIPIAFKWRCDWSRRTSRQV